MTSAGSEREREQKDIEYFGDHYDELKARYPDQWIAVFNQEVVANAADAFKFIPSFGRRDSRAAEQLESNRPPNQIYSWGRSGLTTIQGGSIK